MDIRIISVLFLALICKCSGQLSARATFNSRGIVGSITFTEVSGTSNISIEVSLRGLRGGNAWHVHTLPVDQTVDPAAQCLSANAGPHYDPFNANNDTNYGDRCRANDNMCEVGDLAGKFGPIPVSGIRTAVDSTGFLALQGPYSIVGRSLVIHRHDDNSNFECGTIRYVDEEPGNVIALQARFVSPVAGTIYLRQVAIRSTAIWGKLYWVNDMNSSGGHEWHIHQTAPGEEYRIGDCSAIGPHFGVGSGRHEAVDVSANPSPFSTNSFFFTDSALNLSSVVNKSIAVHVADGGSPVLACAPLVLSEDLVLYTYQDGVLNRNLRVSQLNPFEDTVIMNNIQDPITVLGAALNPVTNCRSTENIYAPYAPVDAEGGEVTPDSLVLGAWDQRYDLSPASVSVFDMPIHGGNNTISGKTVRQISGADNRMCSALLPNVADPVIMAKANFNGIIQGAIYLVQEDFGNDQLGNTHIIVDIYYSRPEMQTSGHNWHVHQNPTQDNTDCVDAIGGHYNPFMVSLANTDDAENPSMFSSYRDDCNVRFNLRCESGDLSGKHGRLSISSEDTNRPVVSFVDSNLALTGSYSIIGRSIGLHDITPGAPLFDCGDINRVYISSTVVSLRIDADRMLRSQIASTLTEGSGIDPTDVLILSQTISPLGFGFNCVNVSARILGSTQATANMNAEVLSRQAALLPCNSSLSTVKPLSIMLLIVCLLAGLGY